jgi:hypothetical protein
MAVIDDLVAWWVMRSGAVYDAYGDRHLTAVNSPGTTTGPMGGTALTFVASSSQYLQSDVDYALGDNDWSFAVWYYPTENEPVATQYIFGAGDSGSDRTVRLGHYTNNNARFDLIDASGSQIVTVQSSAAATINGWNLVVVYHDSVNDLVGISLNGSAFVTGSTGGTSPETSANTWLFGRRWAGGYYDGYIGHSGHWERVLTSTDVSTMWASGSGWAPVTQVETAVAASGDDGYAISSGTLGDTSSNLIIGVSGGNDYEIYTRHLAVGVAQGATIPAARWLLYKNGGYNNGGSGDIVLDCHLEDTDDAAQISSVADFNSRTLTTAKGTYTIDPTPTTGTELIDITDAVQEVVNRGGWSSGNDMQVLGVKNTFPGSTHRQYHETYDAAGSNPPLLMVTYQNTEPGGGGGGGSLPGRRLPRGSMRGVMRGVV